MSWVQNSALKGLPRENKVWYLYISIECSFQGLIMLPIIKFQFYHRATSQNNQAYDGLAILDGLYDVKCGKLACSEFSLLGDILI